MNPFKNIKVYADIADFEEDSRIQIVGETVMRSGKTVGVCVDKEPDDAKALRYRKKLTERFPGIVLSDPFDGPTPETTAFTAAPPKYEAN